MKDTPSGACLVMRAKNIGSRSELVDREYFFGKKALDEAELASLKWRSEEAIQDLDSGTIFELRIHPAWRSGEGLSEELDYDDTENLTEPYRFVVKEFKKAEVI